MDEYLQRLQELPRSELPKIWWSLFEDKWPEELGEKPAWVGYEDRMNLARWIQDRIGVKACYRYMNTEFNGMTDQMFDDYWDSCEELGQQRTNASQDSAEDRAHKIDYPFVTLIIHAFLGMAFGVLYSILRILL